jgi:hypothetical protein
MQYLDKKGWTALCTLSKHRADIGFAFVIEILELCGIFK